MAPSPPHISFKSTKFDKLNSVVTDLSSADRIPPEILHTIVQSLTESQSDGFPYDWTFVYHDHKERVEVCRYIQLDILRVASINRLWYNSALSLLYRKPFLSSIRSLRLFARTVSHSLVLASLVKEIVVLPQDDYFYDSHLDRRGWLHNIIARRQSESVRRHTTTILRHCPSIQTLTADSSVPNLNCGIKSAFERTRVVQPQDVASFGKSIRRLVFRKTPSIFSIDSHKTPIFPANICQHLPFLEDLCFREIQFPDAYSFPPMLHLRTLQIAQCTHQQNHIRVGTDVIILVSSTLMPSLSSLGLFQNSIRVHVDNQALLGLNILGLIGPAEYDSFVLWCQDQPESLVNIRELTFGTTWYPIIGEDEGYNIPDLENISFDHLQSLTCIVWGYGLGHSDLVEEVSARILLRLTQRLHSMGNFSNSGLRDLEIITIGSSDLDTEFTSVALLISCIHEECIRKGINFHIQEDGESIPIVHITTCLDPLSFPLLKMSSIR